ncbi:hypothetical protein AAG570_011573 [Ranatra chinensis]|uniref:Uncharacterized protein n=1 Tax=Ranatra chinensis TaxID=642074 RepID=A0ABD0YZ80_9HEMI
MLKTVRRLLELFQYQCWRQLSLLQMTKRMKSTHLWRKEAVQKETSFTGARIVTNVREQENINHIYHVVKTNFRATSMDHLRIQFFWSPHGPSPLTPLSCNVAFVSLLTSAEHDPVLRKFPAYPVESQIRGRPLSCLSQAEEWSVETGEGARAAVGPLQPTADTRPPVMFPVFLLVLLPAASSILATSYPHPIPLVGLFDDNDKEEEQVFRVAVRKWSSAINSPSPVILQPKIEHFYHHDSFNTSKHSRYQQFPLVCNVSY